VVAVAVAVAVDAFEEVFFEEDEAETRVFLLIDAIITD
jgi:hypothetical protein